MDEVVLKYMIFAIPLMIRNPPVLKKNRGVATDRIFFPFLFSFSLPSLSFLSLFVKKWNIEETLL